MVHTAMALFTKGSLGEIYLCFIVTVLNIFPYACRVIHQFLTYSS